MLWAKLVIRDAVEDIIINFTVGNYYLNTIHYTRNYYFEGVI